ncbi:hypothetical protein GGR57DRAFT_487821 [Xylariaceae sp. FL1272]|nr:hypothetical protein GGR57DRAFT_487821 [Xylariaceae sp. FL1272]
MSAVSRRQKACIPCAESKRRCDKSLPECQRCIDKDVDCAYPQPKRRHREVPAAVESHAAETFLDIPDDEEDHAGTGIVSNPRQPVHSNNETESVVAANGMEFGYWDSTAANHLDPAFVGDITMPYLSPEIPPFSSPWLGRDLQIHGNDISKDHNLPPPFFLRDETFVTYHKPEEPECITTVEMEPFIGEIDKMFHAWVTTGSNSFIHRKLYDKGMPACVQDAFTTFAAYANRTPATKETILQIAHDRATALARHAQRPAENGVQEIWAHLARVHSMFVYVFIQLFDGSVRMRATAEQRLPILRSWVTQMWETVKRHRWENYPSVKYGTRPALGPSDDFHSDYDTAMEIWQLWILTESVRRTYLVIDTVLNTFKIMTAGWAQCEGYVMFTVRRGLWSAESAMKWFHLCEDGDTPLIVPSMTPGPVIAKYPAGEFDDFAKLCWSFVFGADKIQSWVDKPEQQLKA